MKAVKVVDLNNMDGFDKTVEFTIMNQTNVDGNNNKFYAVELQENEETNEFRVYAHYGRVGAKGTHQYRGPASEPECRKEMESLIKKKQKGKKDKKTGDYLKYTIVDVAKPTVGSVNIVDKDMDVSVKSDASVKSQFAGMKAYDAECAAVIGKFFEENVHSISINTSIKFTSNGAQTELGTVTPAHVDEAKGILTEIDDFCSGFDDDVDITDSAFRKLNSKYFTLIPRKFGHKITDADMIQEAAVIANEYDLLDQLKAAVQIVDSKKSGDSDAPDHLGFSFKRATPADAKHIIKSVEDSRRHNQLNRWKPKHVYEVENFKDRVAFGKASTKLSGRELSLFHGSRNSNCLSIMMNGLFVPPSTAAHVTGRMFGDGIYAAPACTKALNYSTGFWGGVGNKNPFATLFVVQFAMGKEKRTQRPMYNGPGSGYDSIYAASGSSLVNDEVIVYNNNQATLRYVILFEEK